MNYIGSSFEEATAVIMFEVHHFGPSDPDPFVTFQNGYHRYASVGVKAVRGDYERKTWANYLPIVEETLNRYFTPIPKTDMPIVCVDRTTGVKHVHQRLVEMKAKLTRKVEPGWGWKVSFEDDRAAATRADTSLHLARRMLDAMREDDDRLAENCFVRKDYVPESRSRSGGKRDDDGWTSYTGRLFSVRVPRAEINTSGDAHLHDRIDRAFKKHGTNPSAWRAWQTKEDWRSRPREAAEATFRSLHLGATQLGELRFGRLVVIRNKPTGPDALTKPAAFSKAHEPIFYDEYLDGERKKLDPRGWGRKEYEKACWEGDEEALNAPLFFNKHIKALTVDTLRDEFDLVVGKARIKCGNRPPWMHLGRADATVKALDDIEALDLPEFTKVLMRRELAEYMGWRTVEEMLKVYGARHFRARKARGTVGYQTCHGAGGTGAGSELPEVGFVHDSFADAADLVDLFDR